METELHLIIAFILRQPEPPRLLRGPNRRHGYYVTWNGYLQEHSTFGDLGLHGEYMINISSTKNVIQ